MRTPLEAQVAGCTYSVSPWSLTFPATFKTVAEVTLPVTVTTGANCAWQSTQNGPEGNWFITEVEAWAVARRRVRVLGPNTTATAYTDTVQLAGQLVSVTQRGR
jgi:hypothetical protein